MTNIKIADKILNFPDKMFPGSVTPPPALATALLRFYQVQHVTDRATTFSKNILPL
jgi:hypothetical protein